MERKRCKVWGERDFHPIVWDIVMNSHNVPGNYDNQLISEEAVDHLGEKLGFDCCKKKGRKDE